MTVEERVPSATGASLSGLGVSGPAELVPTGPGAVAVRAARPAPLEVAHVASAYRRYPGERVTFFTRVQALAALSGFSAQISLPSGLVPDGRRASAGHGDRLPEVVLLAGNRYLIWTVERHVSPGEVFEYEVDAVVRPTPADLYLESQAIVTPGGPETPGAVVETVSIAVPARGRYLQYLPRVYQEQDELMGRFLMLFESFWAPIDAQTDHLAYYFDPEFTPSALLPWLATWVDLALDERWPEDKRRRLLSKAVSLYRKRGTRRGLQEYLEIYTGARVQISEHGANNFRLGPDARLGLGVALGTLNMPHTFTVTVFLPAEPAAAAPAERTRLEAERRHMIEAIIEAEKPAHTSYNLRLESV
jgi:phage tail-like protein